MKTSARLLSILLYIGFIPSNTKAQVNVQDSLALVDLYNSTDGPNWKNNTNWLSGPVNTWYGVYTGASIDRIEEIWLQGNNLTGTLPASLGNLNYLGFLSLSSNHLTGSIPEELGNVGYIYLNNNQLTGSIPKTFVKQADLFLQYNLLSGSIPEELGNNQYLMWLYLDHNQLSGAIPASLGNAQSLSILSLDYNQLTGNIPKEIGAPEYLGYIGLSHNQLTGTIPYELSNHHTVDLSNNKLSGPIPAGLTGIANLLLDSNRISGTIPETVFSDYLSILNLADNLLTGDIPGSIGNPYAISYVNLSNNQLTGNIPESIAHSYALSYLNLSNNRLTGRLPASFGSGTSLATLNISRNKIWGKVPASLSKLNLAELDLSHNRFGFEGMELIAQTFPLAIYNKQKAIPIHLNDRVLSVFAGGTLSNNTYIWARQGGDDTVVIKGDSTFRPIESGLYRVKVINKVAKHLTLKSDTISFTVNESFAKSANATASLALGKVDGISFNAYPNPVKNILFIQSNGVASFSLVNQWGKTVTVKNINGNDALDVSSLAPGIYYLRNNETGEMKKVVTTR